MAGFGIMCSLVVLVNSQVSQVLWNKTNDFDLLRWFSGVEYTEHASFGAFGVVRE